MLASTRLTKAGVGLPAEKRIVGKVRPIRLNTSLSIYLYPLLTAGGQVSQTRGPTNANTVNANVDTKRRFFIGRHLSELSRYLFECQAASRRLPRLSRQRRIRWE